MHRETHVVIGALTGAMVFGGGFDFASLAGVAGAGAGAVIPDFDTKLPLKHRGLSHTVWPALVIMAVGFLTPKPLGNAVVGAGIGYLSHLLADGMTVSGVAPFAPFSAWRMRGAIRTTGNLRPFFFRNKRRASKKGTPWDWREQLTALVALLLLFSLVLWG